MDKQHSSPPEKAFKKINLKKVTREQLVERYQKLAAARGMGVVIDPNFTKAQIVKLIMQIETWPTQPGPVSIVAVGTPENPASIEQIKEVEAQLKPGAQTEPVAVDRSPYDRKFVEERIALVESLTKQVAELTEKHKGLSQIVIDLNSLLRAKEEEITALKAKDAGQDKLAEDVMKTVGKGRGTFGGGVIL